MTSFVLGTAAALTVSRSPHWLQVASIDSSYFAAAALTSTIPIFSLPPGGVIHGIKLKHGQSFGGGGITGYTISVGDINNSTLFASAFNVFTPVSSTNFQLSDNFYSEDDVNQIQVYATATSTGANLLNATSGIVNIWALLSQIPTRSYPQ